MRKQTVHHRSHRNPRHARNHLAAAIQNDISNIRHAIFDATTDVKNRANEVVVTSLNTVKERSIDVKDSVEGYVAKKPFKSLGIAALSGFIMGMYLIRRR